MNLGVLSRYQGIALAISFVVGSGILVLPILSLKLAGPAGSLQAWILMTLIGIPLVKVFYRIHSIQPTSLSGMFARAFGEQSRKGARLTVLAALMFGMPAMIYTAAQLLFPEAKAAAIVSHLILTVLCVNHLRPLRESTRISLFTSGVLCVLILMTLISRYSEMGQGFQIAFREPPRFDQHFFRACVLSFFGYVGWESFGFFVDQLKNPHKDLKWVFGGSFIIVSIAYLGLSAAVTGTYTGASHVDASAGILNLLPNASMRLVMTVVMALLLLANLNAWIFGGKRQLMENLGLKSGKAAIFLYYLLISSLLLLIDCKVINLAEMFMLSNQCWIIIYGGALCCYFRICRTRSDFAIGMVALISFTVLLAGCSAWILLGGLFFMGDIRINFRTRAKQLRHAFHDCVSSGAIYVKTHAARER